MLNRIPCIHVQTLYTEVASNTLGAKVMKARYVGHTSATFATRVVQPPEHGLLGPLISAEVSRALLSACMYLQSVSPEKLMAQKCMPHYHCSNVCKPDA